MCSTIHARILKSLAVKYKQPPSQVPHFEKARAARQVIPSSRSVAFDAFGSPSKAELFPGKQAAGFPRPENINLSFGLAENAKWFNSRVFVVITWLLQNKRENIMNFVGKPLVIW